MTKQVLLTLVVLFTLFAFPSCRKAIDFIHSHHPGSHDTTCRIETIDVTGYYGYPDQYRAYYNAKGDPDSLIDNNALGALGNPRYFFRYDAAGRLSDHMAAASLTSSTGGWFATVWHKYGHPHPNYVTDTLIEYAGDVRGPSPLSSSSSQVSIKAYTLDGLDRIVTIWAIKDIYDTVHAPLLQSTVTYNANGNLPLSDPSRTYDNKVNPLLTSKVWPFVFMNYSRNNVIGSDNTFVPVYNAYGLPLHLQNLNYGPSPFGLIWNTGLSLDISYSCSAPRGPINY